MHAILRLCCCCCLQPARSRKVAAEPSAGQTLRQQQLEQHSLPQLLRHAETVSQQKPTPAAACEAAACLEVLLSRWMQTAHLAAAPGTYAAPCSSVADMCKALAAHPPPAHPHQQHPTSKQNGAAVAVAAVQTAVKQLSGLLLAAHKAAARGRTAVAQAAAAEALVGATCPAADQLVALLRSIQMPQVGVEAPSRLQRYQGGVGQLLAAGGWPDVSHLAACCSPDTRGLLAYWLQGSASAEGDRKVNLIVTRDTPLWDGLTALQQAAARGPAAAAAAGSVLPPADSLDNIALAPAVGHTTAAAAPAPAAAGRQQLPGQQQRMAGGTTAAARSGADSDEDYDSEEEEDNLQVVIAQAAKLFPRFMMATGAGGGGGGGLLEAGEGHGPRKEFFLLLGTNATSATQGRPPLLIYHKPCEAYWLNAGLVPSPQLRQAFWLLGWVAGQAPANRAVLGVPLAPLLWHKLLGGNEFESTPELLEAHDPAAAANVRGLARLSASAYQELLSLEGLPLDTPRQDYMEWAVERLLVEDVDWQYRALQAGFWSALEPEVLQQCCLDTPPALAAAVTGCGPGSSSSSTGLADGSSSSGPVDVRRVFRVVVEDGEQGDQKDDEELLVLKEDSEEDQEDDDESAVPHQHQQRHGGKPGCNQQHHQHDQQHQQQQREVPTGLLPVVECLWLVLGAWTQQQQRSFVRFVTGTDRLPAPGTEVLTISSPFVAYNTAQQAQMLGMLPQAHTCSNTLELPNYWEALMAVGLPAAAAAARTAAATAAQAAAAGAAGGGGQKGAPRKQQQLQGQPDWVAAIKANRAAAARSNGSSSSSSSSSSYWAAAGEQELVLVQQCCSILHARLQVATTMCATYALDDNS